jgi:hypothetical protein
MTDAHTSTRTLHLVEFFPAHEARADDPHYRLFDQTRRRLKRLGKLVCWIGNADCQGGIELHHAFIEYALINLVDIEKVKHLYPELHIESDEDFIAATESEGGLLPLCVRHHRGDAGIHTTTYPAWLVQRVKKNDAPIPERNAS